MEEVFSGSETLEEVSQNEVSDNIGTDINVPSDKAVEEQKIILIVKL